MEVNPAVMLLKCTVCSKLTQTSHKDPVIPRWPTHVTPHKSYVTYDEPRWYNSQNRMDFDLCGEFSFPFIL